MAQSEDFSGNIVAIQPVVFLLISEIGGLTDNKAREGVPASIGRNRAPHLTISI